MIILECDPDEFLILRLGFPRKKVKHAAGKGKVLELVRKCEIAIGIIDEDPQSFRYRDLDNYDIKDTGKSLTLLSRKEDSHKKLIQVSEYLEHWLISRAKANQIDLREYGLPDDPRKLHDMPHVERNRDFQKFIDRLIEADSEAKKLKKWISDALR